MKNKSVRQSHASSQNSEATADFPRGIENMWGPSKFDGEGAEVNTWGETGGLKMLSKNTCEGVFDSKVAGYKPTSQQIY